jgi:hypothetical protein
MFRSISFVFSILKCKVVLFWIFPCAAFHHIHLSPLSSNLICILCFVQMEEMEYSAPLMFPTARNQVITRRLISPGNSVEVPLKPVISGELEPTGAPDRTFKIVLAGDAAVGKSCFIVRFCKGVFLNNMGSTLG